MAALRSLLFLPASNDRAIAKARDATCDMAVLDLEDAVAPEFKVAARQAAVEAIRAGGFRGKVAVRVNGLATPWGEADMLALAGLGLDWIVAPKVEESGTIDAFEARMDPGVRLCAMIETPRALFNLYGIASAGGPVKALMLGTNDLSKALGVRTVAGREPLRPWLAATVAAAKANGLLAIDGVFNRLDDLAGLAAECAQGRLYGFDGKSLIHPNQIEAAHAAYAPTGDELAEAQAVVNGFTAPEARGKGAIRVGNAMVERLHLAAAQALLDRAAAGR